VINRRRWLYGLGMAFGLRSDRNCGVSASRRSGCGSSARYSLQPVGIDGITNPSNAPGIHTGLRSSRFPLIVSIPTSRFPPGPTGASNWPQSGKYLGTPNELLQVMDRKNIRAMVQLDGGFDNGLHDRFTKYDKAFPGRFYSFAEPSYSKFKQPDYRGFRPMRSRRATATVREG